jgi:hypothetical protein
MVDGRTGEALEVIEGLLEQSGGAPEFEGLTAARRLSALNVWQILLEKREDYERLYEAAGIALALLDPADPTTDR